MQTGSLFSSDAERSSFLNRLVTGCRDMMRNNKVGACVCLGVCFGGGACLGLFVWVCWWVVPGSACLCVRVW